MLFLPLVTRSAIASRESMPYFFSAFCFSVLPRRIILPPLGWQPAQWTWKISGPGLISAAMTLELVMIPHAATRIKKIVNRYFIFLFGQGQNSLGSQFIQGLCQKLLP